MAYYESALQYINDSSKSEYFVPAIDYTKMDCNVIKQNHDKLVGQIQLWNERYASGNSRERSNIDKILAVQKSKLEGYVQGVQQCNVSAIPATGGGGTIGAGTTDHPNGVDPGGAGTGVVNNNNVNTGTGGTANGSNNVNTGAGGAAKTTATKPWLKYALIGGAVLLVGIGGYYLLRKK